MNAYLDRKKRKASTTLVISGQTVILFGLWDLIRNSTLYFFTDFFRSERYMHDVTQLSTQLFERIYTGAFIVFLVIGLLLCIYIGQHAIAEGCGTRKGSFYLILASLYLIINILGLSTYFLIIDSYDHLAVNISSFLIDLTSILVLVDLLRAAYIIRHS